ncbi:hypothetical protein Tco_0675105 [Tanacetum coccineum]
MTTTAAQQVTLDNALVPPEKRVEIGKCNMRINPAKTQKEPTYQVILDALALTTCYPAFLITADVLEIYMHQFWFTINKHDSSYRFKIGKKRFTLNVEVFREIIQICPKFPNQEFDALPSDEEIVSFIKELGHKGDIKSITEVVVDQMYQPWRTFAAIMNKCLFGKITDFTFQIENRDTKKQEKMYYPRFTKAIIYHFSTKDKSISLRNKMFMHTAEDDSILGPMRFDSPAYKTYLAYAIGAATPKKERKFKKPASPSKKITLVTVEEEDPEPAKKKKAPTTTDKSKGIDLLSEAALLKEAQVKKVLKRSQRETTIHQAGGSGDGASFQPEAPDEPQGISVDINEGTGLKLGVPNVSKAESSKSEYESWGDSGDEANVQDDDEDVQDKSDNEFVHTPLNYVPTYDETNDESNDVDEEKYDRIDKELYGDVNVRLTDAEQDDEGEEDADMADSAHV